MQELRELPCYKTVRKKIFKVTHSMTKIAYLEVFETLHCSNILNKTA